jgi:hypothetical protein
MSHVGLPQFVDVLQVGLQHTVGNLAMIPKGRFRSAGRGYSDFVDYMAPSFRTRILEEPGRPPLSECGDGGVPRKRAFCWKKSVGRPGIHSFGRGTGGASRIPGSGRTPQPSRNRRFFPQGCSKIAGSAISEY